MKEQKKLSKAQQYIIDTLISDADSEIIRDEFLGRRFYIKTSNGSTIKVRGESVSALHQMNLIKMSSKDAKLKHHYTLTKTAF